MDDKGGIPWVIGDEEYPFPPTPGEDVFSFVDRWLRDAPYSRITRDGDRFIHEVDATNLVLAIAGDVVLLNTHLLRFGDQVLTQERRSAMMRGLRAATAHLTATLELIEPQDPSSSTLSNDETTLRT
jgi:hypothetical protein